MPYEYLHTYVHKIYHICYQDLTSRETLTNLNLCEFTEVVHYTHPYLTPRRLRALDEVVQEGRAGLAPRERAGLAGPSPPVAVAQVQHQKLDALAHL